jgi:hypothetical protein
LEDNMINTFRRIGITLAALTAIGGAGVGIAGAATPVAAVPAHTVVQPGEHTWFDPFCEWRDDFDWHYYNYCDSNFWHGSHFHDWEWFDRQHHGWDYDRHR